MIRIERVDSPPNWYAVLIVADAPYRKWQRTPDPPRIRCVGFPTATKRDWWLAKLTEAMGALADGLLI